ncbi:L,D-transpeptidase [Desulforamulus ruminis]|uniref:L,D-transpeptidase n=1 Tax=Desulforamulus ruminis TaxID=1564 RepID=UPI001A986E42|nr:L,D-transpeptidase [Desulforamulus ruminis]
MINLSTRRLAYHKGDGHLNEYPVGIGKTSTPTPTGTYAISEKAMNPLSAELGTRLLRLSNTKTCIHGTDDPVSIGNLVSGG